MNEVYFLFAQTMIFSIPLLIVALGGMFSERSGVVNIGLEGIMIMGGFTGIFFINIMQDSMSGQFLLILAIIISVVTGIIYSAFHAYASINMNADQIISGTALNMFAPAFAVFVARMIQTQGVQQIPFRNTFRIAKIPVLGDIPVIGDLFFKNFYITTYLGILILIVSSFVIFKTKFGLRLRSCGEHPQAADSVGINVVRIRYAGVLISGGLAGLGGLIFIIPTSTTFDATVAGYGFLALAVLIFGQWNPKRIFLVAIFFGFLKTISAAYSGIPFLAALPIPNTVYKIIPFAATMVVLAFTSKKSQAPRAAGQPFDKGRR